MPTNAQFWTREPSKSGAIVKEAVDDLASIDGLIFQLQSSTIRRFSSQLTATLSDIVVLMQGVMDAP